MRAPKPLYGTEAASTRNLFILLSLLIFFSAVNYFWLLYDTSPPSWDESLHGLTAMNHRDRIADLLENGNMSAEALWNFFRGIPDVNRYIYPPLYHFIAGVFLFITGDPYGLAMVNTLFMGLLLFSLYFSGRKIHSNAAGLISVLFIVFYPIVYGLSRQKMIDFPLLSMTSLSFCLLLYSDGLQRNAFSWLFGISAGLGMLTKPNFFLLMIVPSLFLVGIGAVQKLRSEEGPSAKGFYCARLFLISAAALGIALFWYWPQLVSFKETSTRIVGSHLRYYGIFTFSSAAFYLKSLYQQKLNASFLLCLIWGLVTLRRNVHRRHSALLLCWLFGSWILFFFFPQKHGRQDIGLLVPISLISGIAMAELGKYRTAATSLALALGIIKFSLMSFPNERISLEPADPPWRCCGGYVYPPHKSPWKIKETLALLGTRKARVAVICEHFYINGRTFSFYGRAAELPLTIFKSTDHHRFITGKLHTMDYIVNRSDRFPGITEGERLEIETINYFYSHNENFSLFMELPLPDGEQLIIYRNTATTGK